MIIYNRQFFKSLLQRYFVTSFYMIILKISITKRICIFSDLIFIADC